MNILSSMLTFLLNRVLGVENRMGGTSLPSGTNINNLTKAQSGWWTYDRTEGHSHTGTYPTTDTYGTIAHFQGTSSNYAIQILRSNNQGNSNAIIYVRYKVGGTWGSWQRYVNSMGTSLTINRVDNPYFSETDATYPSAYKKGGFLTFRGNFHLSASLPTGTADVKVANISGWNAVTSYTVSIPAQSGNATLLLIISSTGDITISNYSGVNTNTNAWFRFTLTVPCAAGYE